MLHVRANRLRSSFSQKTSERRTNTLHLPAVSDRDPARSAGATICRGSRFAYSRRASIGFTCPISHSSWKRATSPSTLTRNSCFHANDPYDTSTSAEPE